MLFLIRNILVFIQTPNMHQ